MVFTPLLLLLLNVSTVHGLLFYTDILLSDKENVKIFVHCHFIKVVVSESPKWPHVLFFHKG